MEAGSMKSLFRYTALATVLTIALGMRVEAATSGTKPTPAPATPSTTTPVSDRSYPTLLPLTLEVAADETFALSTFKSLSITAQREGHYIPIVVLAPVDPFTEENACRSPMPQGIAGCAVNSDATIGTLRVDWQVPEAGTYQLILSGKRGGSDRVHTIGAFELEARD
jgi:hypothetical protein